MTTSPDLLTEVEAASRLGFARFSAFTRAVKTGALPQPDIRLPDGPRWRVATLSIFLGGESSDNLPAGQKALARLRHGQDEH